ncbi:MAG TPA: hypothetical protein VHY08_25335 [Bacillota bacterium]|nr:hypothetical protein [Bacillota bacterium]
MIKEQITIRQVYNPPKESNADIMSGFSIRVKRFCFWELGLPGERSGTGWRKQSIIVNELYARRPNTFELYSPK